MGMDPETTQSLGFDFAAFLPWMGNHPAAQAEPSAHVFVACNAFMSQQVFSSLLEGGFEFRTQIIRLVQILRGGDRPKLGQQESRMCAHSPGVAILSQAPSQGNAPAGVL
ncbi:MAG: hypothetical protein F4226_04365 [Synechococcus sp. SB0678_bin_12]|nr:hypothetical protein [Synechococcus sp. SB0678_bin_12]